MNTDSIIRLLEEYARLKAVTPITASTYCAGAGDFYSRLKRGRDVTTRRAARVVQWLSDHWPDGAEWPADSPRPPPVLPADRAA